MGTRYRIDIFLAKSTYLFARLSLPESAYFSASKNSWFILLWAIVFCIFLFFAFCLGMIKPVKLSDKNRLCIYPLCSSPNLSSKIIEIVLVLRYCILLALTGVNGVHIGYENEICLRMIDFFPSINNIILPCISIAVILPKGFS
jgi:hypothetical protein